MPKGFGNGIPLLIDYTRILYLLVLCALADPLWELPDHTQASLQMRRYFFFTFIMLHTHTGTLKFIYIYHLYTISVNKCILPMYSVASDVSQRTQAPLSRSLSLSRTRCLFPTCSWTFTGSRWSPASAWCTWWPPTSVSGYVRWWRSHCWR